MKELSSSVSTAAGVLSVMTYGITLMQKWFADSSDFLPLVSIQHHIHNMHMPICIGIVFK